MDMKKLLILFTAIFFLTGCVKIINDDLKAKESKLVLNAAISPDSTFTVNLSRTFNIFDDESDKNLPFIDGAKVRLFEDGAYLFDLENQSAGYYVKAGFYPETNKEYAIDAAIDGYKTIESKSVIPKIVPLADFDTVIVRLTNDPFYGNQTQYVGLLTYQDPAGVSNQYQLKCKIGTKVEDGNIKWEDNSVYVPDVDDSFYDRSWGELLWNDKYSDGKEVEIRFVFYSEYPEFDEGLRETDTLRFMFYFQSVNQEYYTYLKSFGKYLESGGSSDPFSEPVVIYSNVKNGYGIFAGFDQDTATTNVLTHRSLKGGRK
jgi:hypothetical protein